MAKFFFNEPLSPAELDQLDLFGDEVRDFRWNQWNFTWKSFEIPIIYRNIMIIMIFTMKNGDFP
jgi:hypothetical protein